MLTNLHACYECARLCTIVLLLLLLLLFTLLPGNSTVGHTDENAYTYSRAIITFIVLPVLVYGSHSSASSQRNKRQICLTLLCVCVCGFFSRSLTLAMSRLRTPQSCLSLATPVYYLAKLLLDGSDKFNM